MSPLQFVEQHIQFEARNGEAEGLPDRTRARSKIRASLIQR